ncbi:integral to membrane protein [Mucor ambiguus]|uniref:Glycerophosphocholine acyltransferase 1 n=1 Tax=Mucor ambiguus TaxID=91626 RepID=A0A0C9LV84_9FUNG|nr:integral to membrane protein [Mucor ambiguus]
MTTKPDAPDDHDLQDTTVAAAAAETAASASGIKNFGNEDMFSLDEWETSDFISENDFDMIDMLSAALDQVTNQLEDKQREFITKSSEWTNKTRDSIKTQTKKLEDQRSRIQELLVRQYHKIDKRMNRDAKTVQLRDKVSFVVGVGNACVAPALALRYPSLIPSYYSSQLIVLLILRYVIYRSKRWHYFIFDICYFVNAMTMLFLWAYPTSKLLFVASFCMTNGPVAWAIITWRNSLVFHSLDKVTSVFIHIFPPLVMYCIRWMPELQRDIYCDNTPFVTSYRNQRFPALDDMELPSFKDVMIYSTLAYGIWQSLYYLFIMVGRRDKVESGLRLTSYSWLLDDTHGKKGFIQKMAFMFGPKWKSEMFMFLQLVYNIATSIPTFFLFKYFWLHTTFLIAMFAVSVWNGANYYIEVFSRRYISEIESIKAEDEKLSKAK